MTVMQTFTGKLFDPLDPDPAMIDLRDIAHALGNICRFGGHARRHYSVAEHSLLVASLVPEPLRLPALLHDAAEAYIGDIIAPIKRWTTIYVAAEANFIYADKIEEGILSLIFDRFGLALPLPPEVQLADRIAVVTELRDLLHGSVAGVDPDVPGWQGKIPPRPDGNQADAWLEEVCLAAELDRDAMEQGRWEKL